MERVREKLHSRTGASLLIALLFFLVAMTVGAVVLTAASANAGRIQKNRQEQQNYLAVASAAELVKEDIAGRPGTAFTASYQKVVTEYSETWTDAEGKSHTRYWTETYYREGTAPSVGNGKLLEAARSDLGKLYYSVIWNPEIGGGLERQCTGKNPTGTHTVFSEIIRGCRGRPAGSDWYAYGDKGGSGRKKPQQIYCFGDFAGRGRQKPHDADLPGRGEESHVHPGR